MTKKRKTKSDKIKIQYRLKDITIGDENRRERKSQDSFSYLSSDYIKRDLLRTVGFSVVIIGIELYLSYIL